MIKKIGSNSNSKKVVCQTLGLFTSRAKAKKNLKMYFTSFLNSVRFWHTPFFKRTMGKIKAVVHLFAKNVESHEKSSMLLLRWLIYYIGYC